MAFPPSIDRWTPSQDSRSPRHARECDTYIPSSRRRSPSSYKRSSRRERSRSPRRSSRRDRIPPSRRRSRSPRRRSASSPHRSSSPRRRTPSPHHNRHNRHRSPSRTTISSISVTSRLDIEEQLSETAARYERSNRLPGPPILAIAPAKAQTSNSPTGQPRLTAVVASKVILPDGSTCSPIPESVSASQAALSSPPSPPAFTMVGNYLVPAPKPTIAPPPKRPANHAAKPRKSRPPIPANFNLRNHFIGPGGSFVYQLQDKYNVSLTNRRIHDNFIAIHVQARTPITEENEKSADWVHKGVKLWVFHAEVAMKAGAKHPLQNIVNFFNTWKG